MTKENKFSFIRNAPIQESSSPKKERKSRKQQINPRKQRKPEAIAIYPEIYLHAPSKPEQALSAPIEEPETPAAPEPELEAKGNTITEEEPLVEQDEQQQEQEPPFIEKTSFKPQLTGRPKGGRRSNSDYEQVTAYIRRETYTAIKIALLQRGKTRGFSELVEELLIEHLQNS